MNMTPETCEKILLYANKGKSLPLTPGELHDLAMAWLRENAPIANPVL